LITEPFVLTSSNRWQQAVENDILAKNPSGDNYKYDFYFGNTGLIDVFSPKAKTWFWDIYKNLTDLGVSGWWGDLGEPEVHPEDMIHHGGLQANQVHNIYGNEWAKLISEGYSRDYSNHRPFILMRSAYSGAQRYGLIPWSGDVNRTWGGLFGQTEIALQMGMQGIAFMHSDLGGFAGPNEDDELYTRWLQYGVFQPIFRPHGQEEVAAEPIFKSSKTKALVKTAIELRYSLLPYNYNLVFENHQTGVPLMRPLLFEEPNNKVFQSLATTYLWGEDFLISPVVLPNIKTQKVHFPETSDWFDFYTDKKLEGGSIQDIALHTSYIPTYVRSGAFVPRVNGLVNTDQYDMSAFDLHFYFGSDLGSYNRFYNDDGHTKNAIESGEFEFVEARSKFLNNILEIAISQTSSSDSFKKSKSVNLIIHNIQKEPKWVKSAEEPLLYTYDEDKKTLSLQLELKANSNFNIVIKKP
jgi:alpha-glucosidase (family GH31 glycosyl hydrolase)